MILTYSNILAGHFTLAKFKVYKTASAIECLDKLKELNNRVDIILINGTIAADTRSHANRKYTKIDS